MSSDYIYYRVDNIIKLWHIHVALEVKKNCVKSEILLIDLFGTFTIANLDYNF